ncbi:RDD family protein [Henriciella marina]|uniref:RDD family protein n=1 Tax=Henriciella marina TaxID=453851 RepID=UPI00037DBA9C|nr:RDD family protein [Henriciella marina]
MARKLKLSETNAARARREALRRRDMRLKEQARQSRRIRPLVTPEGAALNLRIATASERAGAFLLDFSLQIMAIIAFSWVIAVIFSEMGFQGWQIAGSISAVIVFLLRVFYFVFFEIGRKAATPGKRALGLRVASRGGGRLTANAVLARNFMRELEVFLPLTLLVMGSDSAVSAWIRLLALVWAGVFVLFPLFNSDKLRVGDLIAGTMVIHAPRVKLKKDITSAEPLPKASQLSFTTAELDAYGIHELHVLEDVLRQSTPEIKTKVADRIRAKIGRDPSADEDDLAFLETYYAALRARLEQRMLFGERKADKFDTGT